MRKLNVLEVDVGHGRYFFGQGIFFLEKFMISFAELFYFIFSLLFVLGVISSN